MHNLSKQGVQDLKKKQKKNIYVDGLSPCEFKFTTTEPVGVHLMLKRHRLITWFGMQQVRQQSSVFVISIPARGGAKNKHTVETAAPTNIAPL